MLPNDAFCFYLQNRSVHFRVLYADAKTFRNLLRRVSVGMQPEGLAGMTNGATPEREAIYISRRKGFIRIAIQVRQANAKGFLSIANTIFTSRCQGKAVRSYLILLRPSGIWCSCIESGSLAP